MKKKHNYNKKLLEITAKNASQDQLIEAYQLALKEVDKKLALHAIYFKLIFISFIFFSLITIDFILTYTEVATFPIITFIYNDIILISIKFIRRHWKLFAILGVIFLFVAKIFLCCEASGTSNKENKEKN